jgi:hypothetical protein
MVDWKAHHGALQKLPFQERKFVLKFIHQSLPMGKINHKIDPTQSTTCSTCKRHQEMETHLYRCPVRRVAIEDVYLEHTLQEFLEANHTCPKIAYTLLEALYSDLEDSRYPEFGKLHGSNEPSYRKLHQKQAYIGWSQLFQGRLVKDWGQLQEAFIEINNETLKLDRRYYSGAIWARKLVTRTTMEDYARPMGSQERR